MYASIDVFSLSHKKIGTVDGVQSAQRSYVQNGIGQARIIVSPKNSLYRLGILDVGKLITINSDQGITPWGGWITRLEQTYTSLTITARELGYIFTKRRLGKSEFFPYKSTAELSKQLTALTSPFVVQAAGNANTTESFSKEFHFTGGAAALKRLPYDTGVDWWIEVLPNGQGVLHTGNRGSNLSESVVLAEGTNLEQDITYSRDGEEMTNDVIYVGRGDGDWSVANHHQKADHASITQWGLYEQTTVRYDLVHASDLSVVARRELERKSRPRELLDFHVVNVGGVVSLFGEGDILTMSLPSFGPTESGIQVPARIVGREVDEYASSPFRVLVEVL